MATTHQRTVACSSEIIMDRNSPRTLPDSDVVLPTNPPMGLVDEGMPTMAAAMGRRPLPELFSVEAVCFVFNRSPRTIRAWCQSGYLTPVRVGKSVFFRAEDIENMVSASGS